MHNIVRYSKTVLITLFICFIVSSCSVMRMPSLDQEASSELMDNLFKRAELMQQWKLRGEVQGKHMNRSWRVNIIWHQKRKVFKLRVSAITQATLFVINGKGDGTINAIDSHGAQYQSDNDRKLMKQLLGIELPIEYLKSWAIGIPSSQTEYDNALQADGKLISFVQDDWRIAYEYEESSEKIKQIIMTSKGTRILLKITSFRAE